MSNEDDIVARLRRWSLGCGMFDVDEDIRDAADEIERLRAERDEARRKICEIESQCICDPPRSPQKYASLFGWDCYKENKENTDE